MRFHQLMLLATMAAFTAGGSMTAVCTALTWRRVARLNRTPISRARMLFGLRLAPTVIGAVAAIVTMLAFLRHEPRLTSEFPGWILIGVGVIGGGIVAAGIARGVSRWWQTSRLVAALENTASPVSIRGAHLAIQRVETLFPLIAVTGIWRPRLLIARPVLREMPEEELELVLRHELAHARYHDNLAQLLMAALPDLLNVSRWCVPIERAWRQAAEEAADDFATGGDEQARACLASALLRVARLFGQQNPPRLSLPAFHEGASIEGRVRRLVEAVPPPFRAHWASALPATVIACLAVGGTLAEWDAVLMGAHAVIEWLVNVRP